MIAVHARNRKSCWDMLIIFRICDIVHARDQVLFPRVLKSSFSQFFLAIDLTYALHVPLLILKALPSFIIISEAALEFLRAHRVLPLSVKCPYCDKLCSYRADKYL